MKPAFTHVAIFARDIDASVDFYRRYAELIEVHRRTDHEVTVVWLGEEGREQNFVIVLIEAEHADAAEPPPMAHIGYAVGSREDVDRLAAMAKADGFLKESPVDAGKIVGYYTILTDPDGNWVEFSYGQQLGPDA